MNRINLNRAYLAGLQAVSDCVKEGRAMTHCTFVFGRLLVLARPSL